MKRKAVFLDRDGTLIRDIHYLNDPDQIEYLPGVFDALKELRDAGFEFVIATNQSGIARGIVQIENLNEIHRRLRNEFSRHGIEFLAIYYAPYMPETNHFMRKPNAGMLHTAADEWNIDLSASWMIGDKVTDVEAGFKAGCKSILLSESAIMEGNFLNSHLARSMSDLPKIILGN